MQEQEMVPKRFGLQTVPEQSFQEIKDRTSELFLCSYAPLFQMSKYSEPSWGYALFDQDCHLLHLFGHADFLRACADRGIQKGTDWSPELVGETAIGSGTRAGCKAVSSGRDYAVPELQGLSLYFSPIYIDLDKIRGDFRSVRIVTPSGESSSDLCPKAIGVLGGIAVISFTEIDRSRFEPLAEATSREISLQLIWFNNDIQDISNDTGHISIDQSRGRNQITVMSKNIYRFFKLSSVAIYRLRPLESLIDPIPANGEFWSIVQERRIVQSYALTLTVGGQTMEAALTTYRGTEERFHMKEFVLYFQFNLKVSTLIHQYSGNTPRFHFSDIICKSQAFKEVLKDAKAAARSESSILILGESGAGKDVLAQAIHNASRRNKQPFVVINCAVFSRELIASELFGYEAGAFTGAKKTGAIGKFEMANHGTLFLDEIGDMPLDLQAHLLRAIEQKQFMKVGGITEIQADVRILAATNINLLERIQQRLFREDLYYRLSIVNLYIPPLRKRPEDIIPLAEHFISNVSLRFNKPIPTLSPSAVKYLLEYRWSGNIRELQNVIEGVISVGGDTLTKIDAELLARFMRYRDSLGCATLPEEGHSSTERQSEELGQLKRHNRKLISRTHKADRESVVKALEKSNYNLDEAAEKLGVSKRTLYRRLDEYGLME